MTSFEITTTNLYRLFAAALPHTSSDADVPVLSAVRLELRPGILRALATDRYSMIVVDAPTVASYGDLNVTEWLVDSVDVKRVLPILKAAFKSDSVVRVETSEDSRALFVRTSTSQTTLILVEGSFPKLTSLMSGFVLSRTNEPDAGRLDTAFDPKHVAKLAPTAKALEAGLSGRGVKGALRIFPPLATGKTTLVTWDALPSYGDDPSITAIMALMPYRLDDDTYPATLKTWSAAL